MCFVVTSSSQTTSHFNMIKFGSMHSTLFSLSNTMPYTQDSLDRALQFTHKLVCPTNKMSSRCSFDARACADGDDGRHRHSSSVGAYLQQEARQQRALASSLCPHRRPGVDSFALFSHSLIFSFLLLRQVSNTEEVIEICRQNASNSRVFSIGLGDEVSRALVRRRPFHSSSSVIPFYRQQVEGIARAADGTAQFIVGSELTGTSTVLEARIIQQLRAATQPALSHVVVDWGDLVRVSSSLFLSFSFFLLSHSLVVGCRCATFV